MNSSRWQEIRELYHSALKLVDEKRAALLNRACGDDGALRGEVESLLRFGERAGDFLEPYSSANSAFLASTAPPTLEKGARLGSYSIRGVLGVGGMGVVYEAEQESPSRTVALKVIRPGAASKHMLRRFEHEAQLLGRLQHPGIAQIFEAGSADAGFGPQPFFAMELLRGEPITRYAKNHELGTRERLELLAKVCDAVEHAHQKGIIHRDLKPGNILVTDRGEPKILDFGVARATDRDLQATTLQTQAGQLIGTLAYMSPEQVAGDPATVDTRTDVYALGLVLFELLTDRTPYDLSGVPLPEAARIISEQPPPAPASLSRALRGELETIILKAIEKDPDCRYASAAALGGDIKRFLNRQPILARPPSLSYQLRKLVARHTIPATLVLALFLSMVGSTVWVTVLYTSASAARETAERKAATALVIQQFLQNMLSSADPDQSRGREVTVREMLDQAADGVGLELTADPAVEAGVRATIGQTYLSLAMYDEAETHLERALSLALESQEEATEIARRQYDLARLRDAQGRFSEAEALLNDALALHRLGGTPDADLASTLFLLGRLLRTREELDSAEVAFREALELRRVIFGERSWEVGKTLRALGQLAHGKGDYKTAVSLIEHALEIGEETLGEHRELADTLVALAQINQQRRVDRDQIVSMHRRALEIRRKVLGDSHPDTAESLFNIAINLDDGDEMLALLEESLRISVAKYGESHPGVAGIYSQLGRLHARRGLHEEAERFVRRALDIHRATYGPVHTTVAIALNHLGNVLRRAGRAADAETAFRESLATTRKVLGADNVSLAYPLISLATVLVESGRDEDALPLYREAHALRVAVDHRETPVTKVQLGMCLFRLGKYDAAEPLLLETYETRSSTLGERHARTLATLKSLVELYDAWGKPDRATEWRSKQVTANTP